MPIAAEEVELVKAMECRGFTRVAPGCREARIHCFHQQPDRMTGAGRGPPAPRAAPVIGPQWHWPSDPRVADMQASPK
jgi:hypothetical protein